GISPKHNPVIYTLEVRGERANNPKEKALLSVLYAY
ncbi:MAG: type IV pilus assembly protein PilX, partial [uncultured bacterium]